MSAFAPPNPPFDRRTWLHRLVLLEPGETRAFLWAAAYFFFMLFSYYLLKPVRDTIGIRGELTNLPWLWTATTIATLVIAPLFALVVSLFPRRTFVPWLYRIIGLVLLAFWGLLTVAGPKDLRVGYAFFVWVSVYNLLSTSVFWGFMADVFNQQQGKRMFGAIGVGGTLGAILGASIPAILAPRLGPINLILISVALLEVVAQCVAGLCRQAGFTATAPSPETSNSAATLLVRPADSREPNRDVAAGFVLIAKSPYLQLMVVYMLLFTTTSTFLEFEQARVIKTVIHDEAERTQMYSSVNLGVNILTLITQLFLTGRILTLARGWGILIGLLLLPMVTILGFSALWRWETMAVLLGVQIVRKAMHYAVDRPTREVLYTVLGPDAKYKSKSFIDTFVYRSGDVVGIWTSAFLNKAAITVSAVGIVVAGVWAGSGVILGLMQRRIAARAAADATVQSPPTPAGR